MNSFEFKGKKYIYNGTDEFTFAQYEVATGIVAQYFDFIGKNIDIEKAENDVIQVVTMLKALTELNLAKPLIALLFVEEGQSFSKSYFDSKVKEFDNMPVKVMETVRADLINFLNGGAKFITENSLIYSPTTTTEVSVQPEQPPNENES